MSDYVTSMREHDSVEEAIEKSFAPGYEVLYVGGSDEEDKYWAVAEYDGDRAVYEYQVEAFGGEYHFQSIPVNPDTPCTHSPEINQLLNN